MRSHARALAAAAIAVAVFAAPAPVLANRNTVEATCETGLTFDMERGEAGTTVTVILDNAPVAGPFTVANHGDPLRFSVPAPADRTVAHSWVVLVDSVWNQDQRIVRSVPPCASTPTTAPAATSTSSTSSTTSSTPTSTSPSTSSTSVTSTTAPPSTVVVPTLRNVGDTTTTSPASPTLPATGTPVDDLTVLACACVLAGLAARCARRSAT